MTGHTSAAGPARMTLTQLSAFVFVARRGSVKAAARELGVSDPAVSQALGALRQQLGDPLLTRTADRMALTEAGRRLLGIATQMIALGAAAERAVRSPVAERLHLVATSVLAEFVSPPLANLFSARHLIDTSFGTASADEMEGLLANGLADVALGPRMARPGLVSEPVLRCRLIVVGAPRGLRDTWLVDPSGIDPGGDTGLLLRRLRVPETRIRVFPNQTAAWNAAADGAGVAPAIAHLVTPQMRRGELATVPTAATPMETCWYATTLEPAVRSPAATALLDFLAGGAATQLMRSPEAGVPKAFFRPQVSVTLPR
ncbi:LysR family transcriptional regulator [Sinosporangium siamense]|uniref:LysR family transcriptional regulator n=1 Tax=Sinosporangium siamense TaxID=1367973 RepID=UPI0035F0C2C2